MRRAPAGLGPEGRRFWRDVLRTFELNAAELLLLERAGRMTDRLAKLDYLASQSQPLVRNAAGVPVPNPVYQMIADLERGLEATLRGLALPMPEIETEGRRRSPQQTEAARARWRREGQRRRETTVG